MLLLRSVMFLLIIILEITYTKNRIEFKYLFYIYFHVTVYIFQLRKIKKNNAW